MKSGTTQLRPGSFRSCTSSAKIWQQKVEKCQLHPRWNFRRGLGTQFCRCNLVRPNLVSHKKIIPNSKFQERHGYKKGASGTCESQNSYKKMAPAPTVCLFFDVPTAYPRQAFCTVRIVVRFEFEVRADGNPSTSNICPYKKATPWITPDKMVLSPPWSCCLVVVPAVSLVLAPRPAKAR